MAGRPPKPTALKLVEGNRGKRTTKSREPEPMLLNDLLPPPHLSPRVAAVWRELAKPMRRAHVLSEIDVHALEMTASAIADYRQAAAELEASPEGPLQYNPASGSKSLNPWAMVKSMTFKQAMAGLKEFGATPAARARVVVEPQDDLFANAKASRYF